MNFSMIKTANVGITADMDCQLDIRDPVLGNNDGDPEAVSATATQLCNIEVPYFY
jgi:hypothetical protein